MTDTSLPLPDGDPCFYCEIAAGRGQDWLVVTEEALTMTLLNGRQFEVGQCVIIPKRHAPTLLDLNDDEQSAVMAAAKRLATVMTTAFDTDGILLYQNNGVGSGQEVPHFHLHVVPRQPGSDWGFGPPHLERLEKEGRLKHHDHSMKTDDKLETIGTLRERLNTEQQSNGNVST